MSTTSLADKVVSLVVIVKLGAVVSIIKSKAGLVLPLLPAESTKATVNE